MAGEPHAGRFVFRVAASHVVTYLLVGILAALIIDYRSVFEQPVVRDYMRAYGSVALFVGPLLQVVRGLIFAVVLLPFRRVIGATSGWLWLFLLLLGVGVLSTPAAAPSSIEGVVYTVLPLWYHGLGLPEMIVQIFLFSVLVGWFARHPAPVVAELPREGERVLRAVVVASLGFAAYAVVSVVFALAAGASLSAPENLSWSVQGIFLAPFVANGTLAYIAGAGVDPRGRVIVGASSYVVAGGAILAYQAVVAGEVSPAYALVAPILPALVVALTLPRRTAGRGAVRADPGGPTTRRRESPSARVDRDEPFEERNDPPWTR